MAPHSSTLPWRIPWMEEPGRLRSMGSHRVGHDFTFTFTFHFHALEKAMATHSSTLAWRIPWMEEPGGLPSMGSHRVGRDRWLSRLLLTPKQSRSVVSYSVRPHGLWPSRLLHPGDFPGKGTGVGCHFLLQGIFPIQGSNPVSRISGRHFTLWATRETDFS